MTDRSRIEWTEATWNPVTGCSKVSPGCAHCYAERISLRFGRSSQPWLPAHASVNVELHPERLDQPLRWRRPRLVFVNSMSDLFHELVPDAFIVRVWNVMAVAQQHTFQVLTKRPDRMVSFLHAAAPCGGGWLTHNGDEPSSYGGTGEVLLEHNGWPLPNVWLGTSIENQRHAYRADQLREAPAAERFISAEPLLGPLEVDLEGISWLIVGGESGPGHRPCDPSWVRVLRDQAIRADCRFFFKQWGGATPKSGGRQLDGRTWDEMPERAPAVLLPPLVVAG